MYNENNTEPEAVIVLNNERKEQGELPEMPLVSIVIPCYNHGCFLRDAISSALNQSYTHTEIIVVDDGSVDNTEDVAGSFKELIFIKQKNSGLPAARNTGLSRCKGEYVVFLDADDMLHDRAVETNIGYFLGNKSCAFVSGGHKRILADGSETVPPNDATVKENHYEAFLQGNYIGMHAAVMYRRDILIKEGGFDPELKACEDYELYFRLSRKYPVLNHSKKITSYRIHDTNMSGNIPLMLMNALHVLNQQLPYITGKPALLEARKKGIKNWKRYYIRRFIKNLMDKKNNSKNLTANEKLFFVRYFPFIVFEFADKRIKDSVQFLKSRLKNVVPEFIESRYLNGHSQPVPGKGKVQWGDLRRTNPISRQYGFDRGGPVDRYYIEKFLQRHSQVITGRVMEVGDNEYTLRYGGDRVEKSDILHVHAKNPKATFIGDLTNADHLPSNSFNCIVLTQTLHLIYDYKKALGTCLRILKPGGSLLLTVPGISQIEDGEWGKDWLWSFTERSMELIFRETFPEAEITIEKYGNVLAACAFLYGIGAQEITPKELDGIDPLYQVVIAVKATKKG